MAAAPIVVSVANIGTDDCKRPHLWSACLLTRAWLRRPCWSVRWKADSDEKLTPGLFFLINLIGECRTEISVEFVFRMTRNYSEEQCEWILPNQWEWKKVPVEQVGSPHQCFLLVICSKELFASESENSPHLSLLTAVFRRCFQSGQTILGWRSMLGKHWTQKPLKKSSQRKLKPLNLLHR